MKRFLSLFFLSVLVFSCTTKEDVEPSKNEPRTITVRSIVDMVVSPMSGKHEAQDGLILTDYEIQIIDELGNPQTQYIDVIYEGMTFTFDNVVGDAHVIIYRYDGQEPFLTDNYVLRGEDTILSGNSSISVEVENKEYSYIVIQGPKDSIKDVYFKGQKGSGNEYLTDANYPEHDAYYVYSYSYHFSHMEVIVEYNDGSFETVKGFHTQPNYQYTYTLNGPGEPIGDPSRNIGLVINPGFEGSPIEMNPGNLPHFGIVGTLTEWNPEMRLMPYEIIDDSAPAEIRYYFDVSEFEGKHEFKFISESHWDCINLGTDNETNSNGKFLLDKGAGNVLYTDATTIVLVYDKFEGDYYVIIEGMYVPASK
ncbi:hypothetical protein [Flammeovirga aprica]|uniref:Uncharacterized protein n=1 Tax=Flammeovirga aprica JL-4 TaxID=694437 RepID=A0A7X9XDN6_9BACT|nr:hypothetical protein [Flammeovirga aprica]NME72985.1 hypothetical protein [Flammeovirga aprica JL-4]